jgi:chloramphenicol 3-O phosphotransferase
MSPQIKENWSEKRTRLMEKGMPEGNIIFLNGTSSSGKTTLALALQEILPEPYLHIALDQFRDGMPARYRGLNSPEGTPGEMGLNVVPVVNDTGAYTDIQFGSMGCRMLKGMRRAIACMAHAGNNVIIDDIIMNEEFLLDYLDALEGLNVVFVGIRCPMAVIDEREQQRVGRFPGTAIAHFKSAHAHGTYDVEVNTSSQSPQECAEKIRQFVSSSGNKPAAFHELRTRRQN